MNEKNIPQILLLDDDREAAFGIRDSVQALYPGPIDLWTAHTPKDARSILTEQAGLLDVVVTDIVMADGTPGGLDIAAESAGLPVIVISAFDRLDFGERSARLGPVQFIEKGRPDFGKELVRLLRSAIAWTAALNGIASSERELRSVSIAWESGTILAFRSHLQPTNIGAIGNWKLTQGDFHPIAVGFRSVKSAIERTNGSVYAFHDQDTRSVFLDSHVNSVENASASSTQPSVLAAVEACLLSRRMMHDTVPILSAFPFGAGLVPATVVTGIFGNRTPGHASVIGRPGDIAYQIALHARSAEIGLVIEWLHPSTRDWWNSLAGDRRTDRCRIVGVNSDVEIEFLKAKVAS